MSEEHAETEPKKPPERSRDLLGRQNSRLRQALVKTWTDVKKAFEDQAKRADDQMDYWDAYFCQLNDSQYYDADAQIYVPIIRDAVNACATRWVNQLFPQGGNYVEAVSTDGTTASSIVALLDQYIREGQLKTKVAKVLVRHGMLEGQLNLYVDWMEIQRQIVSRETHGPRVEIEGEEVEVPGGDDDDIEDRVTEDRLEARPACEVLHDSDVVVWPASADSLDEAFNAGGGVAIVRRWSKAKVEAMTDAGHINKSDATKLIDDMTSRGKAGLPPDVEKALAEMVGIRKSGSEVTVWEVWKHIKLKDDDCSYDEDGTPRICRVYFGTEQQALGCVRNPHWNDRVPILSEPMEKIAGVFKGMPPVAGVMSLQYEANDAANEGADAAHYAAMPIVMRNPAAGKQPLIMNIGALWDVDPAMIKFAEFPDLTPRAITRIQYCIQQIFQSLGVNPSMLPQQTSASRRNQAQVAQEQAIDLLTTAESVSVLEQSIFTPLMGLFVDLDYQYRDREMTIRTHGEMGIRANAEAVPPQRSREFFAFRWWGADQARNAAQWQQQIAWMNVARGLEESLAKQGKELDFTSVLESSAMGIFGPRYGPRVIKDVRANLSMDPKLENELMDAGHAVVVHKLDQDMEHIQAHQQSIQAEGDEHGYKKNHITLHLMQAQVKAQDAQRAQMQQQMMAQMQGQSPRGPGQRPSRSGGPPRMGAQPAGPQRTMKGPPGMIRPEQMPRAGGIQAPRRM
jgi:hypothetical protein